MLFLLILSSIFLSLTLCETTQNSLHPDAGLNIIELVTKYGYPIESHTVQTEDGYILTLHRIPHGTNSSSNSTKTPILLMHAFLCSSADWVNMGAGKALAFLLADEGYDVWIGNQRGNTWSRNHVTLDPDLNQEEFWNFSYHEMAVYDQPAFIDYILNATNREQIYYVGHSQGTLTFFIMASEKPDYNDKIKLMTAFAPIAYMGNMPNTLFQMLASEYDVLDSLVKRYNLQEFFPHYGFFSELGNTLCTEDSIAQSLCIWVLNLVAGSDDQVDPNFVPVITSNTPAGSSSKDLLHFLQGIRSGNFSQFDYGSEENLVVYGQETPPLYDISKVTAPVTLYYGNNDLLDSVEDVLRLVSELPNLQNASQVPWDGFNHLDFVWAQDVVELLYNDVIAQINSFE